MNSALGQPTLLTRSITLHKEPEEVFAQLARRPGSFFLDSALANHELSRYSYLGSDPFYSIRSRGQVMDIVDGKSVKHKKGDPLAALEEALRRFHIPSGSPFMPFIGGGVGYLSYELGRLTMGMPLAAPDDLGLPELNVNFYKKILAYDHTEKRWFATAADFSGGRGASLRKRLAQEIEKLAALATGDASAGEAKESTPATAREASGADLHAGDGVDDLPAVPETSTLNDGPYPYSSTLSREQYLAAVRRIKDHIAQGDIYQANFTQRLKAHVPAPPAELYLALRRVSPGPYGCFLNLGDCVVAGQSPELFLSARGRMLETRPIKGTRPRGATAEEDARLGGELLRSEKDQAELVMITDLERNDFGRICRPGTISVAENGRLETFPMVHHLVSVIRGELAAGVGVADILRATFPGGSITGAPKRRAMEIIDQLEPSARGPYTGAVGLFGFDGTIDLNVAIRTFVIRGDQVYFGAGGGIVADSDPEAEYAESMTKARGILEALAAAAARAAV